MNDRYRMLRMLKRHDRQRFAMATVVAVDGSAYRHAGAKMLIGPDGAGYGTISAGCLEEDLRHHAADIIRSRRPRSLAYDLRSEDDLSWGRGAGCNGVVTVYVEPCAWEDGAEGGASFWSQVQAHLDRGERVVCARRLRGEGEDWNVNDKACAGGCESRRGRGLGLGSEAASEWAPFFYAESGETFGNRAISGLAAGNLLPELGRFLADGTDIAVVPLPDAEGLLLEMYRPAERLYIFGAGPDTEPLARLAAEMDFAVTVIDPRSGRCCEAHFPAAQRLIVEHPETYLRCNPVPAEGFVLVMTHVFEQDRHILRHLLHAPPRYLGVLGAKSRTERLLFPDRVPDWLHAPVGLDIGAEGPEEIAVSILAELIRHRSRLGRRSP